MKILILNWKDPKNPKAGGAELVTMEHAKAWTKVGHEIVWFTSLFPNSKKKESFNGVEIIRRGNIITVYFLAPLFYFFSRNKFDVVIDEIHGIPFFTPLYVGKPKKIAFIHEVAGEIWDYMYPFPLNKIGKIIEKSYFNLYKTIPFWTDAPSTVEDLVSHGILRKNCVAIPCPVSNSIITKLPTKEKNPTYIFVSRLVKMKGIENVLEAFSIIYKNNPKSRLWLVGGGNAGYIQHLKNKIKSLEKVANIKDLNSGIKFFGKVSEEKKLKLMRRAHLLLHASVKEGWGLVVLEAASQGTPSVVFKVAGLVDSVQDGKTGIIVKENTSTALAKEAQALVGDKKRYRKLQQGGFKWVKSLTWEKVTKKSLELISVS